MSLQTVTKGKPVTGRKTKYIPSDSKLTSSVLVQGKENYMPYTKF
jgi:hypothetical protein